MSVPVSRTPKMRAKGLEKASSNILVLLPISFVNPSGNVIIMGGSILYRLEVPFWG